MIQGAIKKQHFARLRHCQSSTKLITDAQTLPSYQMTFRIPWFCKGHWNYGLPFPFLSERKESYSQLLKASPALHFDVLHVRPIIAHFWVCSQEATCSISSRGTAHPAPPHVMQCPHRAQTFQKSKPGSVLGPGSLSYQTALESHFLAFCNTKECPEFLFVF